MPTPQDALQELKEMSASIRQAVIVRGDSDVLASTFVNSDSEAAVVKQAYAIIEEARQAAADMDRSPLSQLLVEASAGCLFIVTGDNDTWLAATTGTDPTVGLVLYDANTALKTALEMEATSGDAEAEPDADEGEEQDG